MSDALELAAWRFLAIRRVGSLAVAHVEFIDSETPALRTPANVPGFYETANGASFGEAAIKLSLKLGMPWPTDCGVERSDFAQGKSTAATASAGVSAKSSRRTRAAVADSTTDATGAAPGTAVKGGL